MICFCPTTYCLICTLLRDPIRFSVKYGGGSGPPKFVGRPLTPLSPIVVPPSSSFPVRISAFDINHQVEQRGGKKLEEGWEIDCLPWAGRARRAGKKKMGKWRRVQMKNIFFLAQK